MISADSALITFMESGVRGAQRWDLLTLTLADGTVLRYTDAISPITTLDARTFTRGPLLERDRTKMVRGVQVDTMSITLTPRPVDLVGGIPLLQAARNGALRGCLVLLEWAYLDMSNVFKGSMARFYGRGSPTSYESGAIQLSVRSLLEQLQQQMPRDVYQPRCLNQVFDAGCGKSRAAFLVTGSVSGTPTGRSGFGSALAQAAGYFELGVVRFTSGQNTGVQRTVRSFGSGAFTFAQPFPRTIAAGDTFEATPGCDGTTTTCTGRYANLLRFRGQPYIPAPEVAT